MPVLTGDGCWLAAEQARSLVPRLPYTCNLQPGPCLAALSRRRRHKASPEGRQHRRARLTATRVVAYNIDYAPVATNQNTGAVEKYAFLGADNLRVTATVEKQRGGFTVTIFVPDHDILGNETAIVWGTYRSSTAKWFNPQEITPGGSSASQTGRGLRSKLGRGRSGLNEIQFKIPENLAPVFLGFQLELRNAVGQHIHQGPIRGSEHFAIPIGLAKGNPLRLGASLVSSFANGTSYSVNFAVVSRNANAVSLCLARRGDDGAATGFVEVALDPLVNRKGDVWHARVDGLKDLRTLCWGWRADADVSWDLGNRFHPGQVMLDPYAPVATKLQLPDGANVPPPNKGLAPGSNPPALLGSLGFLLEEPPLHGERPGHCLEDVFVMELDVPSFYGSETMLVATHNQGKYTAALAAVPQMKAMGVNAVMLTPVHAGGAGLGPFGRAPFSFFAPEPSFASGSEVTAPTEELRTLVRELQSRGIEVYLQVEYSLTGEGWDDDASAVSLRGLDAAVYYRAKGVLNCGHAHVRALILDSLRHWARTFNVDGFCFVNAETLVQDREGNVLDNPPLAEAIANDSELRGLKLIAWAADDRLLPRNGERGFPHWATWLERNKRFTSDFCAFFTGHGPHVAASAVATRICGSPDLFSAQWGEGLPGGLATGRRASFGLNCTSVLDSSNLTTTVNRLLPEGAPYGQDNTLKQTLLFATVLSQGTPVIGADILENPSLVELVGQLWQLRRKLARLLSPDSFDIERDLRWYGADSAYPPDWDNGSYLAYGIYEADGSGVYIAYNPYSGPVPAILPPPPFGFQWRRAVDTADPMRPAPPEREWMALTASDYTLAGKAALLLVANPMPMARPPVKPATATVTAPMRRAGPVPVSPAAAAAESSPPP